MEKKTFEERYKDEVLSDNSKVENCKQCKDCIFQNDGTAFTNNYQKSSCMIYQYPNFKPLYVIKNKSLCEYYSNEEENDAE